MNTYDDNPLVEFDSTNLNNANCHILLSEALDIRYLLMQLISFLHQPLNCEGNDKLDKFLGDVRLGGAIKEIGHIYYHILYDWVSYLILEEIYDQRKYGYEGPREYVSGEENTYIADVPLSDIVKIYTELRKILLFFETPSNFDNDERVLKFLGYSLTSVMNCMKKVVNQTLWNLIPERDRIRLGLQENTNIT